MNTYIIYMMQGEIAASYITHGDTPVDAVVSILNSFSIAMVKAITAVKAVELSTMADVDMADVWSAVSA